MYLKRTTLFLIGFALLFALFYSLDIDEFINVTSRIGWEWFLLILCIQLLIILLMGLRWYVIIERYGVSFSNVMQTSIIGYMVNNLTPMSIAGGEPVRVFVISKLEKIKTEKAFATVLVELFLGLTPTLLINLIAIILVFQHSFDVYIIGILGLMGIVNLMLFGSCLTLFLKKEPSLFLIHWILSLVKKIGFLRTRAESVESQLDELFESFRRSINTTLMNVRTMALGFSISVLVWTFTFFKVYIIFMAIGIEIDIADMIIVYAILVAVGVLPLIPGALGIWEWMGVVLFSMFGIPKEAAAAVIIIDRLFFYWLPILLGSIASVKVGLSVRTLMEREGVDQSKLL